MDLPTSRWVGLLLLGAATAGGFARAGATAEAETAYRAGIEAFRARDYAAAVTQLERAAAARPDHADTWVQLGLAQARLEHWREAIAAYRRALEIDPRSAKVHHNLGNVQFRTGDYEAAGASYARALELDPAYLLDAFHHGWTLRQLGREAEAEAAFRHCLEIPFTDRDRRTHIDCLFGLGSMRHRAGDYAASAEMMEQVLRVFPNHPEARYQLAMAYRQLGRMEEANRQLELHRKLLDTRLKSEPIEKPVEP